MISDYDKIMTNWKSDAPKSDVKCTRQDEHMSEIFLKNTVEWSRFWLLHWSVAEK